MKANLSAEERSAQLRKSARAALLESITLDWGKVRVDALQASTLELDVLNALRAIGIRLQEAAGREIPSFEKFRELALSPGLFIVHDEKGMDVAAVKSTQALPPDFNYGAAKFCVYLARVYKQPIRRLDDARTVRQRMFECFGLARAPKRVKAQRCRPAVNPWNKFVAGASGLSRMLKQLGAPEGWTEAQRQTVLREVQPFQRALEASLGGRFGGHQMRD